MNIQTLKILAILLFAVLNLIIAFMSDNMLISKTCAALTIITLAAASALTANSSKINKSNNL